MIPTIYFLVDIIDGIGNPPHPPLFVLVVLDFVLYLNVFDILDVFPYLYIFVFVLVFVLGIIISREKID